MKRTLFLTTLLASLGSAQAATVLTQWNFNSSPSDASSSTGSTVASVGVGTAALIGGTTATFATGSANDLAATDNTGWNLAGFKTQGTGNKEAGAEFQVATTGFQGIKFSYDQRNSGTAAKKATVLYSVDGGSLWTEAGTFSNSTTTFESRSLDLSALTALDNKADVRFRIVATFSNSANNAYEPTTSTNYGTSGTWRFDMVTLTAEQPVPEPGTMAALGLGVTAMLRRRRK